MTLNELLEQVLTVIPNASLEEDNYGQIVIYTDLMRAQEGDQIIPFEE